MSNNHLIASQNKVFEALVGPKKPIKPKPAPKMYLALAMPICQSYAAVISGLRMWIDDEEAV